MTSDVSTVYWRKFFTFCNEKGIQIILNDVNFIQLKCFRISLTIKIKNKFEDEELFVYYSDNEDYLIIKFKVTDGIDFAIKSIKEIYGLP